MFRPRSIGTRTFKIITLSTLSAMSLQATTLRLLAADSLDNDASTTTTPPAASATSRSETLNLKGICSIYDGPSPDQLVGGLVNEALQRDENNESLQKKDKQMNSLYQRALIRARMGAQYMTEYRGFELSSEGADIILGEKLKLKHYNATAYAKQKRTDDIHAKVFSDLLQIAQGLGTTDPAQKEKTIAAGVAPLSQLVGKESADNALKQLEAWSAQLNVPQSIMRQKPWTMMDLQQKTEDLVQTTCQSDPVMGLARRALHKYNQHSKLSLGAAKVINTTLAVGMLSPTIVAPLSSFVMFAYQMATGGPEDMKLLAELYLDKRMECRWKRVNQESGQAINAYNNALMTKNPVLLGLSESFISALGGEETSSRVIGTNKLVARRTTHDDAIDCVQTHGVDM